MSEQEYFSSRSTVSNSSTELLPLVLDDDGDTVETLVEDVVVVEEP
jgi:hypothetical protein